MKRSFEVTIYAMFLVLSATPLSSCGGDDEEEDTDEEEGDDDDDDDNDNDNDDDDDEEEICADCKDEKCLDLVTYCGKDVGCKCMSDCIGEAGLPGVETCRASCALDVLPPAYALLEECTAMSCPDEDECATPKGYESREIDYADAGVSDAGLGGGDLPDCAFDPTLRFDPNGEILQLQNEESGICVRLDRRNDGAGTSENTTFTAIDLLVGPLGEVAHIDDPSSLCYYSGHHNFQDWVHAWSGTRYFDLRLAVDSWGGWRTYELYTSEQRPVDTTLPCEPLANGVGRIGDPIVLLPVIP